MKILKPWFCFLILFLLLLASVTSFSHRKERRRVGAIPMQNCPPGCKCERLNCFQGKTNINCKEVGINCTHSNITQNLDLLPNTTTRLSIFGDDMGHSTLDIFAQFPKLKMLSLKGNGIRSLRLSKKLENLIYLNLDKNRLCYLPRKNFTLLRNLKKLRLEYNNFTFLEEIRFPTRLTFLTLSHNHVESPRRGSFRRLKWLEVLKLENNSITEIDPEAFRHLFSLQTLLLDYNKITTLPDEAFKRLPHVSLVSLTNNQISSIHPNAFSLLGVKWLGFHQIRLDNNRIKLFELDYIKILIPREAYYGIYLNGNPIFCDCKMMLIKKLSKRLLRDLDRAQCASPPGMKGMFIQDIDIDVRICLEDY